MGIVSFGTYKNENETLCDIGNPTGYTRVADYIPWIKQRIGVAKLIEQKIFNGNYIWEAKTGNYKHE